MDLIFPRNTNLVILCFTFIGSQNSKEKLKVLQYKQLFIVVCLLEPLKPETSSEISESVVRRSEICSQLDYYGMVNDEVKNIFTLRSEIKVCSSPLSP